MTAILREDPAGARRQPRRRRRRRSRASCGTASRRVRTSGSSRRATWHSTCKPRRQEADSVLGSVTAAGDRSRSRPGAREAIAWALVVSLAAVAASLTYFRVSAAPTTGVNPRFQVSPPDNTSWGAPLGAPEGSNGGTISPDGTMLAFVVLDATGKSQLWVRPIDSFVARALAGTEGAAFPFWSPDNRSLAFFTQTRLKRVSLEGGPVQTVTDLSSTPRGGTWSSRGVILFSSAGSPIFRVSADGGQAAALTKPDAQNPGHQWPSFLPDGEHFLYVTSGSRDVYLGSLGSDTGKRLFRSDTNAIFAPPRDILFVREGTLLTQRFDANRLELVGEPVPIVDHVSWTIAPWNYGAFSASSTGALTYRRSGGNRTQFGWYRPLRQAARAHRTIR